MKALRRLRALFRKEELNTEMSEEMRAHLELQAAEYERRGMSPEEARYAAQRSFGGVEQIKERARDQRGWLWLEHLAQDLRYGARALGRHPGFALVTVLTLALGIGASTALYTFVRGIVLRSLPVGEPGRLVLVQSVGGDESFSYASYERFREVRSLGGLALSRRGANRQELVVTEGGAAANEFVRGQMVTANYFSVLGAPAALGRVFTAEDERANQPTLVVSHACWQRRFGGDPGVVGRTVQFEKVPCTIVGVMPPAFAGFELGVNPDVWWPLHIFPRVEADPRSLERLRDEGWEWALILGRLAPGVSREQAQAELQTIFQTQRTAFAAARPHWTEKQRREYLARTIEVVPAANGYLSLRQHLARPLTILAIIVGLVLVIMCANLAGLLLARGAARQRELAVRAALGAGRGRLVRQLVTESLLLALLGGGAGVLLAHGGSAFLTSYLPAGAGALVVGVDWTVLLFALGLSVLTGVLFGLLPAMRLSEGALLAASKAHVGGGRSRLNRALVVVQIALSVALLAGAGLFVRSLQKLKATDLGFRPENQVGFSLEFSRTYTAAQRAEVHRRLLEVVAGLPEVRGATVSGAGLFSGDGFGIRVLPEGYTPQADEDMRVLTVVAGPTLFSTLGIPLRAGREFTPADHVASPGAASLPPNVPRVAIVGESFARRYFGATDPVGRTLKFGMNNANPPLEIVGVAADIKYRAVREKTQMEIYVPYFDGVMNVPMTVRVVTRSDPRAFAANIRALVRQIDPQVDVGPVRLMSDVIAASLMQERVLAQLGGFFSVFALLLASFGLYGVLSYGVLQRTREIGVRMALGASVRDVLALVIRQGLALALLGCALGLGAALALTRLVASLLYNVTANDPVTFLATALTLLAVSLLACWLPARRAARVDPMIALRAE